ncbi:hypothetical protein FOZ63_006114, partial [Perkinsus olseni]
ESAGEDSDSDASDREEYEGEPEGEVSGSDESDEAPFDEEDGICDGGGEMSRSCCAVGTVPICPPTLLGKPVEPRTSTCLRLKNRYKYSNRPLLFGLPTSLLSLRESRRDQLVRMMSWTVQPGPSSLDVLEDFQW